MNAGGALGPQAGEGDEHLGAILVALRGGDSAMLFQRCIDFCLDRCAFAGPRKGRVSGILSLFSAESKA